MEAHKTGTGTDMLPSVEINPKGPVTAVVIWLHGLGADGHDFEPIVHELGLPPGHGVRFVFPHAPQRSVTINGGFVMRAWYDIASPALDAVVDEKGILESERQVEELVAAEIAKGVPASRIILAGFSQGGVIALGLAVKFRPALGGALVLSSYVALPQHLPAALDTLPLFIAHGTEDSVVPFALGERSRDLLLERGYQPSWHAYSMPHAVCGEEIDDIGQWLSATLANHPQ